MSGNNRYYKAGVRAALFMLSRGRCYAPECPQRVLRMVDGEPSINIQIAHINGLNPGSARFDPSIPVPELNSFGNLLLLCQAHHGPVDDKAKEAKYSKGVLIAWKRDREGDDHDRLAGLDILGKGDLERAFASAIANTKEDLMAAIGEVAAVNANVAELLTNLVQENFNRPYLDIDVVATLADSATSLRRLPESVEQLQGATRALGCLKEEMDPFVQAVSTKNVEGIVRTLNSASSGLTSDAETASRKLSQVTTQMTTQVNQVVRTMGEKGLGSPTIQRADDGRHWQFFKWGLGTGAGAVLAILITIMVLQN